MKTRKLITTLTVAAAIVTPIVGHAAANPPAFDSCVKAFVASLSTKIGAEPKLREAHYVDQSRSGDRPYELLMSARNPQGNREVARALCTVNGQGEVLTMKHTSL